MTKKEKQILIGVIMLVLEAICMGLMLYNAIELDNGDASMVFFGIACVIFASYFGICSMLDD